MRSFLRVLPIAAIVSVVVPMMAPASVAASPVDQQRARVESIVAELERLEERRIIDRNCMKSASVRCSG